jgi:vacuolar-type H+-ATPase subunit H
MANTTQKDKQGSEGFGSSGGQGANKDFGGAGGSGSSGGAGVGQRMTDAAKDMGHQASSAVKNAGQKVSDAAQKATEQAQSFASGAAQSAQDMARRAADEAKNFAGSAAEKASDAASYLGQKAGDASRSLGTGMESLSETIRNSGPREGMLASASAAVADSLESSGRYLEEHDLSDIGSEITNVIRNNPIPSVLIAVGIGFLLARATRS